jgi:hypothetical protein
MANTVLLLSPHPEHSVINHLPGVYYKSWVGFGFLFPHETGTGAAAFAPLQRFQHFNQHALELSRPLCKKRGEEET